MPPKKAKGAVKGKGGKVKKQTIDKFKDKIIEDKTFGLKNKKRSKKVQTYVQSVNAQVRGVNLKDEKRKAAERKKEKERKAEAEAELRMMFKAVVAQPKVDEGNAKNFVCEYFLRGLCMKGKKCKFSHDLSKVKKPSSRVNIYEDPRKQDTMDNWDQKKLEDVVQRKHGSEAGGKKKGVVGPKQTKIVCRHFLDAIEKSVYGWFWECPNGKTCKYKHALPPGFVFKTKAEREAEVEAKRRQDAIPLEQIIETERAKLVTSELIKVTPETFAKWKAEKEKKKKEDLEKEVAAQKKNKAKRNAASGGGSLSGRALFVFDPSLFTDAADAVDEKEMEAYEEMGDEGEDHDVEAVAEKVDQDLFLEGGDDLDELDDMSDEDE